MGFLKGWAAEGRDRAREVRPDGGVDTEGLSLQDGMERGSFGCDAYLGFRHGAGGRKERTVEFCKKHNKPYWVEDLNAPKETDRGLEVLYWLETQRESIVLNVAGPRESKSPGVQQATREYVKMLIGLLLRG